MATAKIQPHVITASEREYALVLLVEVAQMVVNADHGTAESTVHDRARAAIKQAVTAGLVREA